MVLQGSWHGKPFTISMRPECLIVSLNHPAQAEVFSYDGEGRLWTAYLDGLSYRRGLDGRVIAKWRSSTGERERYWLPPGEAAAIEERGRQAIAMLYDAIRQGQVLQSPLPPHGQRMFERVVAFDQARSAADALQYHQIYRPVGILPPDQYLAVVLQLTEGCSFNTCTFCDFYKDRPFRIKKPDEFLAHARAVHDFLGDGLSLRRSIFLADANALVIPMPALLPLLDAVHKVYNVTALGGMCAFLDGFSGAKKTAQDYARLHDRGLRRVYIGMESGSADLLTFLKKPGRPEDVIEAVQNLKAGGVAVGVIVLLGAGGRQYATAHIRDTVQAINAMELDHSDIIYLSELIVSEGLAYAQQAREANLEPLSHDECVAQGKAIIQGLSFPRKDDRPHISRYDIREFIY